MSSSSWNSRMQNSGSGLISGAAAIVFILTVPLLFTDLLGFNVIPFNTWKQYLSTPQTNFCSREQDPLSRLVRGKDLKKLEATGFACDTAEHSVVCVANRPVIVDTRTTNITVEIPRNQTVQEETSVRPYARQEDNLQYVTPVKILQGNSTSRVCRYNHRIPAVIFSSAFTGNLFHEFDDLIIPLFLTIGHFKSRVFLILEDYNPTFLSKYSKIMARLSGYQVMNPAANRSTHCFPGSVVGLKYHANLFLNSSEIPGGYSMADFRQFLAETYDLKFWHVSQIRNPTLILVSREKTRRFLNEDEVVGMMEEVGFRVVVVRTQELSNLDKIAGVVNSCSVLVGVHGAGLTNELFLPAGAVLVQVEPLGLEWASATYFGGPTEDMGLHYLRYKIAPEESSLVEMYGRNHPVITDPASVFAQGYRAARAAYVDHQDVRVDVGKFKETIVLALQLVSNSYFAGYK
ncbi:Alpha-1,3-arabinosyltransferase XAT3 [Sesamum alatum]|uniref:Alpha-1,3-arabinosyltransferase XAT3 n=1 Tax=Sesamum alatum TaxID=300844 RepID=A0AAE1Y024_9LAMI|nr:Alpha-1,3-arabinosyltransferase XAT3 [Sesamum alatum]